MRDARWKRADETEQEGEMEKSGGTDEDTKMEGSCQPSTHNEQPTANQHTG